MNRPFSFILLILLLSLALSNGIAAPQTLLSKAAAIKSTNTEDLFCHLDYILLMQEAGKKKKVRLEYRDKWREDLSSPEALFLYIFTVEEKAWQTYLAQRLFDEAPKSALGAVALANSKCDHLISDYISFESAEDRKTKLQKWKEYLDEGLKRDPSSAFLHLSYGYWANNKNDYKKAFHHLSRARQLSPESSAIHIALAYNHLRGDKGAYYQKGFKLKDSIEAFEKALHFNRGWLAKDGEAQCTLDYGKTLCYGEEASWAGPRANFEKAEEALNKARKLNDSFQTQYALTKLYCRQRMYEKLWPHVEETDNGRQPAYTSWALQRGNTTFEPRGNKTVLKFKRLPYSSPYVWLVGDFNGWQQGIHPLKKREDGTFEAILALSPGTYRYAFCLDGNNWFFYDVSAPQFINGRSAFTVRQDLSIRKTVENKLEHHLSRAGFTDSTLDSGSSIEEACKALALNPFSSRALSFISRPAAKEFAHLWQSTKPTFITSAHESFLRAYRTNHEEIVVPKLVAIAKEGGIKGPSLTQLEAYIEEDKILRRDELLAQMREHPEAEFLATTFSELCTEPAALDAFGRLVKETRDPDHLTTYIEMVGDQRGSLEARKVARQALPHFRKDGITGWKYLLFYAKKTKKDKVPSSELAPIIEEGLQEFPHSRWLHREYRKVLQEAEGARHAISFLEGLLQKTPQSASIRASLGWFHGRLGDTKRALKEYETAVRVCPGWHWLLVRYGELLNDERMYGTALRMLERAFRLKPTDAFPATMAAQIYRHEGKLNKSVELLEKALESCSYENQKSWIRLHLARHYADVANRPKRALKLALEELNYVQEQGGKTEKVASLVATTAMRSEEPLEFIKATKHYDGGFLMGFIILFGILFSFGFSGIVLLIVWYACRKAPLVVAIVGTLAVIWVQIGTPTVFMFGLGFVFYGKFLAFMDVTSSVIGPLIINLSGFPAMVAALLFMAIIFYRRSEGLPKLGIKSLPSLKELFAGLLAGVGMFFMQLAISWCLIKIFGKMPTGIFGVSEEPFATRMMHLSTFGCILMVVNTVLMAPIFEELFFRAYVYRLWKKHMGAGKGLFLSCLVFAFLHFQGLIHLFLVAVVLAKLYDYFESLWPSIVAHGVMNIAVLLMGHWLAY